MKSINIEYYAILREQRGLSEETIETEATTAEDLLKQLSDRHNLTMNTDALKVVANEEFCEWNYILNDGDTIVFIPPVAGG
jgi:sulfur-carrier protein